MKLAAATAAAVFGLLSPGDWATVVVVVIALAGIVIATPSRRSIKLWKDEADAQKARSERLAEDLVGCKARADSAEAAAHEFEKETAALQREVKTLERFTAQAALETVGERLAYLEAALVTAIGGQSDLTMQTHTILADLRNSLERNGELLEKLDTHISS